MVSLAGGGTGKLQPVRVSFGSDRTVGLADQRHVDVDPLPFLVPHPDRTGGDGRLDLARGQRAVLGGLGGLAGDQHRLASCPGSDDGRCLVITFERKFGGRVGQFSRDGRGIGGRLQHGGYERQTDGDADPAPGLRAWIRTEESGLRISEHGR
ncbi:hypothetical protein GCM10029976_087340 [Kribbella albertanoniae]